MTTQNVRSFLNIFICMILKDSLLKKEDAWNLKLFEGKSLLCI